eukprot:scaffold414123_cov50-Prasinocladus_malaysianus.AAC.1
MACSKEGRATEGLGDDESGKAKHCCAAVDNLCLGGERAEGGLLGALLDKRYERSRGEQRHDEDHRPRDLRQLSADSLIGAELGSESGNEAEHGEAAVDDLGRGAGEGHG